LDPSLRAGLAGHLPVNTNKFLNLVAGLTVFVFGALVVSAYAAEPMSMSTGWDRPYEDGKITGKIVRNPQGDYLGTIGDVDNDSE
jgi:hypothetical protein